MLPTIFACGEFAVSHPTSGTAATAPVNIGGLEFRAPISKAYREILTPDACHFVARLAERFEDRRQELLAARSVRQEEIRNGKLPDFLAETRDVRRADWTVAPISPGLADRRAEITGPPERKMLINALNSGANVYMADFEDSNSPTWRNLLEGQINLRDAIRRQIDYTSPEGKRYVLNANSATLVVRPRGWHLDERNVRLAEKPLSASLFDFGLYFFHNAAASIERGSGPYFYLPKMESYQEARLWNDVFVSAQDALGIARGTIRATVLIETILAAFEMDEILFELREHSSGLNCGRWDYIFSFIKKFRHRPDFLLPDRATVTMDRHFLRSYVDLLVATCHRRGIHAMGGMAAQIPLKDPAASERAIEKVRQDKLREVNAGHDGTWVAHPGLVGVAKEVFDRFMPQVNQINVARRAPHVTVADLLQVPEGDITEAGVRMNVDVGIRYLAAWVGGNGCVPIYGLMEDAATAEISRAQLWQWVKHEARTREGRLVTADSVRQAIAQELGQMHAEFGGERFSAGGFEQAGLLFGDLVTAPEFAEFLTLPAYEYLNESIS
jgi:malate synthase